MKKFLLSAAFIFSLFVLMESCQKEVHHSEVVKEITIDTTISVGSNYTLNLASFGDEGDVANIIQQGTNYAVSQIDNESDMFTSVYHYVPSSKNTGTDQVTISINHNPQGKKNCGDSTLIYINFTIK
jgi:hypothetical protein